MKLTDYLKREKIKPAQFAARLGKPASTITRIISGHRQPGIHLLREIAAATDGQVKPDDFLEPTPIAEMRVAS